jgi:amidase
VTEPTALDLRDALRAGHVSARELVETSLTRIEAQRELGAFVSTKAELALAEATLADQRIARTTPDERLTLPALLGVPTAHKDLVQVRGFTTTHGSAAVPHSLATHDDPIAAAVREAGAICVGKTQVSEFGIAGYSENLVAPPARNPFDTSRTAGGSSGGTAAAVAAGMISAAIASDAGGSIRIPSAACGVIGLKPGRSTVPADASRGLVDQVGAPQMGVSGPIARTARDAALFFDAITTTRGEPALTAVGRADELRGLRIGVSFASPFESRWPSHFDDAAVAAVAHATTALEHSGHAVEDAAITYDPEYPEFFTTVWTQALTRVSLSPEDETHLGDLAQWFLSRARAASADAVASAVEQMQRFVSNTAQQWGQFDVVLTPALAFTAPHIGEFWRGEPEDDYRLQCEWAPQTSMVNVVGMPAITVPTSIDELGLPRGVQLIGRAGSEVQLLQLAEQLTSSARHPL